MTSPTGSSEVSFLGRAQLDAPTDITSPGPSPSELQPTTTTAAPALRPGEIAVGNESVHIDALFDRLLVRLRGELLDERERQGRLLGDGRW